MATAPDAADKLEDGVTRVSDQMVDAIEASEAECAFLLRPVPVEQVREVATAGETMPPKSTYFFPKVPTGIVFNPLS